MLLLSACATFTQIYDFAVTLPETPRSQKPNKFY